MKDSLIIFFRKYPLFLYLLPVFFVLHGSVENFNFVPLRDAALLTAVYLVFSTIFLLLFRLIYKDWIKAALVAFLLMAFHFFFGSIQDALRRLVPGSFLSRYVFLLPLFLVLFVLLIIYLKKRTKGTG